MQGQSRMNQFDLNGRVAVITGAARGIGFAIAQRMLASGAAVAIWDKDESRMRQAQDALHTAGTVSTHVVDLTDLEAVEAATRATVERHGKIDILVNNA